MSSAIIIHNNIPERDLFLAGISPDVPVIEFTNTACNAVRIGFVWENSKILQTIPFGTTVHPDFTWFSQELIDFFSLNSNSTIDLITCNLGDNTTFVQEVGKIEILFPQIKFEYSLDETGPTNGNWIMESSGVDIKPFFFTEEIVQWKNNLYYLNYSQYANRKPVKFITPVTLKGTLSGYTSDILNVVYVCFTYNASAALKSDGTVITWGDAANGGNSSSVTLVNVVNLYSTNTAFAALTVSGSVITWGNSSNGGNSSSVSSQLTSGVITISSTTTAFAALKSNGSVVTWGSSTRGGNSSLVTSDISAGVVYVLGNYGAFAALRSNGSVVTWGLGNHGGNNYAGLKTATNVTEICCTSLAFAALKSDKTVVAWGHGSYGANTGTATTSLTNVVSIVAADGAFTALKEDGTVSAWGSGSEGGGPPVSLTDIVTVVPTVYGFSTISVSGTLYNWSGFPDSFETYKSSLVSVINVVSTDCQYVALKSDGTVVWWGDSQSSPDGSADTGITSVINLFSTTETLYALKSDGSVINVTTGVVTTGTEDNIVYAYGGETRIAYVSHTSKIPLNPQFISKSDGILNLLQSDFTTSNISSYEYKLNSYSDWLPLNWYSKTITALGALKSYLIYIRAVNSIAPGDYMTYLVKSNSNGELLVNLYLDNKTLTLTPSYFDYRQKTATVQLNLSLGNPLTASDISNSFSIFPADVATLTNFTKSIEDGSQWTATLNALSSSASGTLTASSSYFTNSQSVSFVIGDVSTPIPSSIITPELTYLNSTGQLRVVFDSPLLTDLSLINFSSSDLIISNFTKTDATTYDLSVNLSTEFTGTKQIVYSYYDVSQNIDIACSTLKPRISSSIPLSNPLLTYTNRTNTIQLQLNRDVIGDLDSSYFTGFDSNISLVNVSKVTDVCYNLSVTTTGEYLSSKNFSFSYLGITNDISFNVDTRITISELNLTPSYFDYRQKTATVQLDLGLGNPLTASDISNSFSIFPADVATLTNFTKSIEDGSQWTATLNALSSSASGTLTASSSYFTNSQSVSFVIGDVSTPIPSSIITPELTYLNSTGQLRVVFDSPLLTDLSLINFSSSDLIISNFTKTDATTYDLSVNLSTEFTGTKQIVYSYYDVSQNIDIACSTLKPRISSSIPLSNPLLTYTNRTNTIQLQLNRDVIGDLDSSYFTGFDSNISLVNVSKVTDVCYNLSVTTTGEYLSSKNFSFSYLGITNDISFNVDTRITPTIDKLSFVNINKTIGYSSATLINPTTDSPGIWSYSSSNPSVVTISGNSVTILSIGVSTITATLASTSNYKGYSATDIAMQFIVRDRDTPSIGTLEIPNQLLSSQTYTIIDPSKPNDNLSSWVYTTANDSVVTISGNVITFIRKDIVKITASLAQNADYKSATLTSQLFITSIAIDPNSNFTFINTDAIADAFSPAVLNNIPITSVGTVAISSSVLTSVNVQTTTSLGGNSDQKQANRNLLIDTLFSVLSPTVKALEIPKEYIYVPPQIPDSVSSVKVITSEGSTSIQPLVIDTSNIPQSQAIFCPLKTVTEVLKLNGSGVFQNDTITIQRSTGNTYSVITYDSILNNTINKSYNKDDFIVFAGLVIVLGSVTISNFPYPLSNICFPAGEMVLTDSGYKPIERVKKGIDTIRGESIVEVTATRTHDTTLTRIAKSAICQNVPNCNTLVSNNHKVLFRGKMINASELVGRHQGVTSVSYSGEPLYNILLEKESKMVVNGLIAETLNPNNNIAVLYEYLRTTKNLGIVESYNRTYKTNK